MQICRPKSCIDGKNFVSKFHRQVGRSTGFMLLGLLYIFLKNSKKLLSPTFCYDFSDFQKFAKNSVSDQSEKIFFHGYKMKITLKVPKINLTGQANLAGINSKSALPCSERICANLFRIFSGTFTSICPKIIFEDHDHGPDGPARYKRNAR